MYRTLPRLKIFEEFKPYILLVYSFIDEIVELLHTTYYILMTLLIFRFLGGGALAGGGKSQPPLCMKPWQVRVSIGF